MIKPVSVTFECENCGQFFEVPVWNEIIRDASYLAVNLDCQDTVYCESCYLNEEEKEDDYEC